MRLPWSVPVCFLVVSISPDLYAQPLPGTQPLTMEGDLARVMVEGIDRYLTRLTETAAAKRRALQPDVSSREAYEKSLQPKRDRLKKILGIIDERLPVKGLEIIRTTDADRPVVRAGGVTTHRVRWPVLPGIDGEGLWLEPDRPVGATVIVLPDADQAPEDSSLAGSLASAGCHVLVPVLVNRESTWSGNPAIGRKTPQPHREFVYRMAFEMGRHIIGYEVQKVLAAVDVFTAQKKGRVGVYGYGEGGLLAFYAAAVDPRIEVTCVSGYFGPRDGLHAEPIYRNVWSLLNDFGDAEIAGLIAPRGIIIEHAPQPVVESPKSLKMRMGPTPGGLPSPGDAMAVAREYEAAAAHWKRLEGTAIVPRSISQTANPAPLGAAVGQFVKILVGEHNPMILTGGPRFKAQPVDAPARQKRQVDQLVSYTQNLMAPAVRQRQERVWSKLDTSSPEKYQKSQEPLRDYFWEQVIGKLPAPAKGMNPRTRLVYDEPKWKGYEVVLDLYDDVICYGILLVPTDLKPGEKRPVVVCQHGLEGRPTDIVNPKMKTPYYNSFGAQLADRGFVVFAPQNPYIFGNEFRQFVRKANPLGLHIYSFITRQHERILEWLGTLPFVDATRIAYYGLSYGGKVAMRIPALLRGYCLSICSGDFNEWIWKNINLDWIGSYMFTGEYEMYEFDLGNTFNYAEMAALIAPRPFMVERGHSDGVGLDEYVAFEYAKVRRLYAQLGLADRTAIEFFVGGHVINGRGTFAFLHRHLNWPAPK